MRARIDRRKFLTCASLAAMSFSQRMAAAADNQDKPAKKSLVIDTHVHCFAGPNDARFPYHAQAPYRPAEPATPQHLLRSMDDAGLDFAVIVHPEPYQDDHRYLEYCMEGGKGRLKGTCLLFADRPGSMAMMADLTRRLPVVAARIHAYAPDRLPPFGKSELRELWKQATEHNLAIQLHFEPRYAPGFEPLIKEFRDTKVIIDHLGRPFQGTPEEHERVIRWGDRPNTVIKLSALPLPQTYPHRDIGPVVKRLLQAFGPERMIYGGGFGAEATGNSYRAAIERARSFMADLSPENQSKIFGENAAQLFKFRRG